MSKIQIIRIILNGITVGLGTLTAATVWPPEWGGTATAICGALSLSMRAVMAELPRDRVG